MNEPRRLKDDPAFDALTHGALHDEPLAVGPFDLDGLRAKVVAGGSAPPSGPRWTTLVGVSGLTAALVTVALWALLPVGPGLSPLQPTLAPPVLRVGETLRVVRTVEPAVGALETDTTPRPEPAPPVVAAPAPPSVQLDAEPAAPDPRPVVAPQDVVPEEVAPPAPAPRGEAPSKPSGLQAELNDYNRALDAAESGLWPEARERYAAYLQTWTSGRLRTEATLGLLGALVRSERPAEAETLAARLLADTSYRQRADDIRLLRAEALVELRRCDEALSSIEGLRRSSRTQDLRSACRQQRR